MAALNMHRRSKNYAYTTSILFLLLYNDRNILSTIAITTAITTILLLMILIFFQYLKNRNKNRNRNVVHTFHDLYIESIGALNYSRTHSEKRLKTADRCDVIRIIRTESGKLMIQTVGPEIAKGWPPKVPSQFALI